MQVKDPKKTASSAATEAVNAKDIAVKAADSAYNSALASSRSAKEAQTNAEQADTAAKSAAQSKQDIHELKTVINSTAEQIATDRTAVETDKKEVQKAKSDVEDLKSAVEQKSSEALVDLENTEVVIKKNVNDLKDVVIEKGNEAISGIETARDNAINDVNNAKDSAVNTIAQEKDSAVNDVNEAKDNAVAEINKNENVQQIKQNKEDIAEAKIDIEELKDKKITKFYANSIGESYLQDSDNGKIQDLFLYGKSEQQTYEGRNLFQHDNPSLEANLMYKSFEDGIVDFERKATGYTYIEYHIACNTGDQITINFDSKKDGVVCIIGADKTLSSVYNWSIKPGTTYTFTTISDLLNVRFVVNNTATVDGIFVKNFMVEKNSEATAYEPYVGGIPSPNPDYPQEIRSVVNPKVKVCGKNLWNPILKGYINNTNGSITATPKASVAVTDFIKKSGKDITVIARNFSSEMKDSYAYRIGFYDVRKKWIKNIIPSGGNKYRINTFNVIGTEYIRVSAPSGIYDTIQIEKGSEATSYEPYTDQSVQLPYTLNAIPVTSVGNVTIDGQQYVADYVNVECGKLVKMVDSSKLDNTQSIVNKTEWLLAEPQEIDLTQEEVQTLKALATYYPTTNISVNSEQLEGYTVFNYPISMKNGWDYVKQQLGDTRDYIYDVDKKAQDIDTQAAEAYVNSEYAVALTELEVM